MQVLNHPNPLRFSKCCDSNRDSLCLAMADADTDAFDASLLGCSGGFAMQRDNRSAIGVTDDLDVLKRGASSLATDAKRFEDCLLGAPSAGKRRLWRWGLPAVCLLLLREIPFDKRLVVNVDCSDVFNIHANLGARRRSCLCE